MTGGVVFAFSPEHGLATRVHSEWVRVDDWLTAPEEQWVRELLVRHVQVTGSRLADRLVREWGATRLRFHRVSPRTVAPDVETVLPHLGRGEPSAPRSAPLRQVSASSSHAALAAHASAEAPR